MIANNSVPRPIFHFHIPKTAGQTLGQRLTDSVPPGKSWYMQGDIDAEKPETLDYIAKNMRVASAHVNGPAFAQEWRFDLLCIVRNPVQQIISHYRHVRREPAHPLHETSLNLSGPNFLTFCKEWFFNYQARYLVSGFVKRETHEHLESDARWLARHLLPTMDRIRWWGVSEQLNEFCSAMPSSVGLSIRNFEENLNVAAGRHSHDETELSDWLKLHPHLYALDSLLYSEALERYEALKRQADRNVAANFARWPDMIERSILYLNGNASIVAGDGWHPLISSDTWGIEARSGPELNSHLHVRKTSKLRCLAFDIIFVAGVDPDELIVLDADRGEMLPKHVSRNGKEISISVDLQGCKSQAHIVIRSPRIFPLCRFDRNWSGPARRVAYAAGRWRLYDAGIEFAYTLPETVAASDLTDPHSRLPT